MEPANSPSAGGIARRPAKKASPGKVMAGGQKNSRKVGVPNKRENVLMQGLRRATSSLAKSLSRKAKVVAAPSDTSTTTLCNALTKQPLFKEKEKKKKAWQLHQSSEEIRLSPKVRRVAASTGGDTVDSGSLRWAQSGTWPSNFDSKVVDCGDSRVQHKRLNLYDRWLASKNAEISAAQRRVKQLKRGHALGSVLNSSKLKEVFERNHQDDRQDAIQGKKFTYMWILEQEALVPLRLANLQRGLTAHELDVDEWRYSDCINSVLLWEKDVDFEMEDCT
jgi:hypothetical protein